MTNARKDDETPEEVLSPEDVARGIVLAIQHRDRMLLSSAAQNCILTELRAAERRGMERAAKICESFDNSGDKKAWRQNRNAEAIRAEAEKL